MNITFSGSTAVRSRRSLAVVVVLLAAAPCLAQVFWRGDFSTGDYFFQYKAYECGASNGSGGLSPNSCPYGRQAQWAPTTVDDSSIGCTNNCRLLLVNPAPTDINGYTPPGFALRSTVVQGDHAPPYSWWGGDDRNELLEAKDLYTQMYTNPADPNYNAYPEPPNGTPGFYSAGLNAAGDDRFYGWRIFVPDDGTFPDPPTAHPPPNAWHVLLQFHAVGLCDSGGPVMSFGLDRQDDSTGFERGPRYSWVLWKRDTYSTVGDTVFGAPEQNGNYRLWPPYNFPSESPPITKGVWHSFVLHVVWSLCDCPYGGSCQGGATIACSNAATPPGQVEFWVDGQQVYPRRGIGGGFIDPPYRPTIYRWPDQPLCASEDWPIRTPGNPMPVYLKDGQYRDHNLPGSDVVFGNALKAGATYADVAP